MRFYFVLRIRGRICHAMTIPFAMSGKTGHTVNTPQRMSVPKKQMHRQTAWILLKHQENQTAYPNDGTPQGTAEKAPKKGQS